MSREVVISAVAALCCHALLLFGLHLQREAVPLPVADAPIEVSLVAAAPQNFAPPAPEPPAVADVAPPPPPVPEPIPEPRVPEPMVAPTPEPEPLPKPKSRPTEALKRIIPPPAKSSASAASQRSGPPSDTGANPASANSGAGSTRPRYRSNPRPDYPAEARRQRQQGRVLLEVEVSATGRPTSVSLKHSSSYPALDSAALSAVRRWTFEPARNAGVPVASRVEVPVQFDLSR